MAFFSKRVKDKLFSTKIIKKCFELFFPVVFFKQFFYQLSYFFVFYQSLTKWSESLIS